MKNSSPESNDETDMDREETVLEFMDPFESGRVDGKLGSQYQYQNPEQFERLRREMIAQFELTREEFAEAKEIERLQEEVNQLRKERNSLRKRLPDSEDTKDYESDAESNDDMTISNSQNQDNQALQQWVAVLGQVSFVLIGVAIALSSLLGLNLPFPNDFILTVPIWFTIGFLFLIYERHLLSQLGDGV
ncbi:hypothetical protein AB7C87_01875 [Natrarchaeobius sp. A-rgal3]|uniref:hypothetical protein n=1 Tax=Natrarchaeobius versutus TaxID=1679078 RepID=UPI0035107F8C